MCWGPAERARERVALPQIVGELPRITARLGRLPGSVRGPNIERLGAGWCDAGANVLSVPFDNRDRTFFYGADVRERVDAADPAWSDHRRGQYLLRPEIIKPLSIDPWVWRRPSWVGSRLDGGPLPWVGIDEVRLRCLSLNGSREDWSLVAIGVVAADTDERAHLADVHGIDTKVTIGSGWEFLGYDIADGETSGLCNTGYGAQMDAFRVAWAARLNDHGLFSDVTDAMSFRAVTDERVPEHACFTVYGLWLVG